jgi:hypothetical protein
LSPENVIAFYDAVVMGPIRQDGSEVEVVRRPYFWRRQLKPISCLLQGEQLKAYHNWDRQALEAVLEDYKPIRGLAGEEGMRLIEPVSPMSSEQLAALTDGELWTFLNDWRPAPNPVGPSWWVEQTEEALAVAFAQLVTNQAGRFPPQGRWWERVRRPGMLIQVLERARARIAGNQPPEATDSAAPAETEWANWFGIAQWIIQRGAGGQQEDGAAAGDGANWRWPGIVVARFLEATIESRIPIPTAQETMLRELIVQLVASRDETLDTVDPSSTHVRDWLVTAVNSARGLAVDAAVKLALREKKAGRGVPPWVLELVRSRLVAVGESPAIFALLGSHLPLMTWLFKDEMCGICSLLFPPERPEHRDAAIVAHVCYGQPMSAVLEVFPSLLDVGLTLFEEVAGKVKELDQQRLRGEFDVRLGTHIAFYYWNSMFRSEEVAQSTLNRWFATATPDHRGRLIRSIGSIFEKTTVTEENAELLSRVMRLAGSRLRFLQRESTTETAASKEDQAELAALVSWLDCECFPFPWRFDLAKSAIDRLEAASLSFFVVEALVACAKVPDRLGQVLELLCAVLAKAGVESEVSIGGDELKPLVLRGLASPDQTISACAEQCRESLLRLGRFEFLDP